MLDWRIYRSSLVTVVLAVIVFAFSLQGQPGALNATLAPGAFSGQSGYATVTNIAGHFPRRPAGSANDGAIAAEVAQQLRHDDFSVTTESFSAPTPAGSRGLENVIGVRTGLSSGTIVVVAHRDSTATGAASDASGTGVLLDLASVLAGETLNHTIVLASTSGSVGGAGAAQLVHALPGPLDAVLVLGDMAGSTLHEPVVVPWSDGPQLAPPVLRNTVSAALASQAGLPGAGASLGADLVHLAFPLTTSEQGALNASGIPAVLLSTSGELPPPREEMPNATRIDQLGRAALEVISALDSGPSVPAPSAYLQIQGNTIPAWAVRLLVLALIVPVLVTAIDGFARVRRRGHLVGRWVWWVLAGSAPFALAAAIAWIAGASGLLSQAAPGATAPGAVPLGTSGIALLVALALVIICASVALRFRLRPPAHVRASGDPGAVAAVLLVLCAVAVALWVINPFAAVLLVPALHLWMWALTPQRRMHPGARLVLLLAGLAPPALVIAYYSSTLGFGPVALAWSGLLLLAGGHPGVLTALLWCVGLGCTVGAFTVAAWGARRLAAHQTQITVRGPATYAGPGSLGGTESALRR